MAEPGGRTGSTARPCRQPAVQSTRCGLTANGLLAGFSQRRAVSPASRAYPGRSGGRHAPVPSAEQGRSREPWHDPLRAHLETPVPGPGLFGLPQCCRCPRRVIPAPGSLGAPSDEGLHPGSLINILRQILRRAGIPAELYSSHSLRRGFTTCAASNGWDLKSLMSYVGWKDVQSTMRYIDPVMAFGGLAAKPALELNAGTLVQLSASKDGLK